MDKLGELGHLPFNTGTIGLLKGTTGGRTLIMKLNSCMWIYTIVCMLVLYVPLSTGAWQDNIRPKRIVTLDNDVIRFLGNTTTDDHFKLIVTDKYNSLLVGGRNIVYNISISELTENHRFEWYPEQSQKNSCYRKGRSPDACQNYIRILNEMSPGKYLICGTYAFNPMCMDAKVENGVLREEKSYTGKGTCPFDPALNTTAIVADGDLYVATVADFVGREPFIYKYPLRTEQYDLTALNAPNFVSSFALGDFVYFFFRETAIEYLNCGKTLYSRVARVCRHDKGGPHKFRQKWTSFLKSRLNCSVSGDFPFYFNEIQATTEPIEGRYGGYATTIIYGVFTTPENSIPGSAICAFTFQDIMDTFEGNFKGQSAVNRIWLPIDPANVPEPRPGGCVKDSRTLPDMTLNFIKSNSLMDEAVPAFFGQPILIRTSYSNSGRFTTIAVDSQVRTPDGKQYDVLFIGTNDGKVIKAVNTKSADSYEEVEPYIIEELVVLPQHVPITSLKIIKTFTEKRLLVVSNSQLLSINLYRCDTHKIRTCSECVALQDPYCAWDKVKQSCRFVTSGKELIQSIADGIHRDCGDIPSSPPATEKVTSTQNKETSNNHQNDIRDSSSNKGPISSESEPKSVPLHFPAETLAIAVASAAIGALILGFITGFFCGKKCNKDEDNQVYAATGYQFYDQRQNANSLDMYCSRLTSELQEEVTYAEPVLLPQTLNKPANLSLNMSPKATMKTPASTTPGASLNTMGGVGMIDTRPPPLGSSLGQPPLPPSAPQDIPLHYTHESYSTHGTLRSSEKYGTRGRDHRRDFDHRLGDGYSTTRSVKKVYL